MRICQFIVFVLIAFPSYSQEKVVKIIWHNEALQSIVSSSAEIRSIAFNKNDIANIEIRPDASAIPQKNIYYDGWYSTVYAGHIDRFTQKYGRFPVEILANKLDSLRRRDCEYNHYEGNIFANRIEIKVTSSCPGATEMRIFNKVDNEPGFLGGHKAFEQLLQSRLSCTNYRSYIQGDSVLRFHAIIKRDSIVYEARSIDSVKSPLRQLIITALSGTYGWKPYFKEGRNMNSVKEIFVRIRKDGTIEADYLRY